ncbi:J domain-containing protein [Halosimplex halophilum]|uniref:J domain-containing protein n=1 Tax=Halosimplex halophilum TaxID=2559572 RepID=UPI00107F46BE|nr:J domain-containing protein [Halosimplex halophilum]
MPEQMSRIDWPEGYDRTDPDGREPYPGNITLDHAEAFRSIPEELEAWGATLDRVEFAATAYANDSNIPHKSADPDDPGVAVYFRRVDEHADRGYALACDRWDSLRDNARAIALYVRRKRLAERCEVATAESEFETAALPPGDGAEGDDVIVAGAPEPELGADRAADLLGVAPDAPDRVVETAFQEAVKDGHPDQGGDASMSRLKEAREVLTDADQ